MRITGSLYTHWITARLSPEWNFDTFHFRSQRPDPEHELQRTRQRTDSSREAHTRGGSIRRPRHLAQHRSRPGVIDTQIRLRLSSRPSRHGTGLR